MLRDGATTWALSVSVSTGLKAQRMRRNQGCKPRLEIREGAGCSCNRKRQHMNLTSFPFKRLLRAGLHTLWPAPQRISFILHFQIFCVLLFRMELPRVPVCFWSHQGAQCPPATRFHESHLPWHQPLTLSPNLGAGMSNLTLLSCRAEVSPFTDVGYATCSRGTVPHGESWKACPSISIFNKALKNWKTAEDWKNASSPPIFSKAPLNKS